VNYIPFYLNDNYSVIIFEVTSIKDVISEEIEREIESMMERSENESFSDEEKSELFRMIDEREIRGEIKRSTATNKKKTFNINQRKIRYK